MKYGIHNLAFIAIGEKTPIVVDGVLQGLGFKIGATIYQKPFLYGFDDGQVCNGYALLECIDWLNKETA